MPNNVIYWNKVDRSGDTMTGDLKLGMNRLYLCEGMYGAILKGDPTQCNWLLIRGTADANPGSLMLNVMGSLGGITLAEGRTVDGVDVSDDLVRKAGDTMSGNLAMAAGTTVDGIDVSEIHQAKVKTGTYVGNGVDDRDIDIGVDLASKSNAYVIIKGKESGLGVHRIEYSQGDFAMYYTNTGDNADCIQEFTETGFQVGSNGASNAAGVTYRWIAFWQE